jgi:hypothetical protein
MSARIQISEPRVVHEIIRGEAVIVNLANGNYYSTDGVGAELWRCILTCPCDDDLVAFVVASYDVDAATAATDVAAFLDSLQQEGIILCSEEVGETLGPSLGALSPKQEYAAPHVEVFSDMQEMIALDPIHEVDATGWPTREG